MSRYELMLLFEYIDLCACMSSNPGWIIQRLQQIKKELFEQSDNHAKERISERL